MSRFGAAILTALLVAALLDLAVVRLFETALHALANR